MKRILSIVCLVLIVAAFALQLTPYWTFDGESYSVCDMVWLPDEKDNKPMLKGLEAEIKAEYTAEELKTPEVKAEIKQKTYVMGLARGLVVAQLVSLLGAVLFLAMKSKSVIPGICMVVSGAFGGVTFFTNDMLQRGANPVLIGALYIGVAVLGVLVLVPWHKFSKKKAVEAE